VEVVGRNQEFLRPRHCDVHEVEFFGFGGDFATLVVEFEVVSEDDVVPFKTFSFVGGGGDAVRVGGEKHVVDTLDDATEVGVVAFDDADFG